MKIEANLIVSAVGILRSIDMTKMKLSTAYKLRKILDECNSIMEDFEQRRIKMAEGYGTLNEEKTQYIFPNDTAKADFQRDMKAMLDEKIDIEVKKLPVELLDDYIDIEPQNIPFVEWFITGLDDS